MQTLTNALPEPQAAFNHLSSTLRYSPFFEKLASLGYTPQTEDQARYFLELADELRHVPVAGVKQAEDPIGLAVHDLRQVKQQHGLGSATKQAQAVEEEWALKRAADRDVADPATFNAILSLRAAEAAGFAAQAA